MRCRIAIALGVGAAALGAVAGCQQAPPPVYAQPPQGAVYQGQGHPQAQPQMQSMPPQGMQPAPAPNTMQPMPPQGAPQPQPGPTGTTPPTFQQPGG